MCEPNPDGKWGLSFLVEQFFSYGYYGDYGNEQNVNVYDQEQFNGAYYQENEYCNVNNDNMQVQFIQQELSQLSIADAHESANAVEQLTVSYPVEQFQAFTGNEDLYYDPSPWNYCYGGDQGGKESNEMGALSPGSSPRNRSYDDEDNSCNLEITDETKLDGDVVKRLNEVNVVPHTPKINGDIPSIDEASFDHERLLERLQLFNLVESKVEGDGNCQFRALSDQFYRTPDHHRSVRHWVVNQLKSHPDLYEGYVPMAYTDYLRQISMSGEWGDHVTLQAAADSYGVKIFVLTSFKDTIFIEIVPKALKSRRVIFLSYWAEVHYNSIYPEGDFIELPPSRCGKKKKSSNNNKKRWWNFKNRHLTDPDCKDERLEFARDFRCVIL